MNSLLPNCRSVGAICWVNCDSIRLLVCTVCRVVEMKSMLYDGPEPALDDDVLLMLLASRKVACSTGIGFATKKHTKHVIKMQPTDSNVNMRFTSQLSTILFLNMVDQLLPVAHEMIPERVRSVPRPNQQHSRRIEHHHMRNVHCPGHILRLFVCGLFDQSSPNSSCPQRAQHLRNVTRQRVGNDQHTHVHCAHQFGVGDGEQTNDFLDMKGETDAALGFVRHRNAAVVCFGPLGKHKKKHVSMSTQSTTQTKNNNLLVFCEHAVVSSALRQHRLLGPRSGLNVHYHLPHNSARFAALESDR